MNYTPTAIVGFNQPVPDVLRWNPSAIHLANNSMRD